MSSSEQSRNPYSQKVLEEKYDDTIFEWVEKYYGGKIPMIREEDKKKMKAARDKEFSPELLELFKNLENAMPEATVLRVLKDDEALVKLSFKDEKGEDIEYFLQLEKNPGEKIINGQKRNSKQAEESLQNAIKELAKNKNYKVTEIQGSRRGQQIEGLRKFLDDYKKTTELKKLDQIKLKWFQERIGDDPRTTYLLKELIENINKKNYFEEDENEYILSSLESAIEDILKSGKDPEKLAEKFRSNLSNKTERPGKVKNPSTETETYSPAKVFMESILKKLTARLIDKIKDQSNKEVNQKVNQPVEKIDKLANTAYGQRELAKDFLSFRNSLTAAMNQGTESGKGMKIPQNSDVKEKFPPDKNLQKLLKALEQKIKGNDKEGYLQYAAQGNSWVIKVYFKNEKNENVEHYLRFENNSREANQIAEKPLQEAIIDLCNGQKPKPIDIAVTSNRIKQIEGFEEFLNQQQRAKEQIAFNLENSSKIGILKNKNEDQKLVDELKILVDNNPKVSAILDEAMEKKYKDLNVYDSEKFPETVVLNHLDDMIITAREFLKSKKDPQKFTEDFWNEISFEVKRGGGKTPYQIKAETFIPPILEAIQEHLVNKTQNQNNQPINTISSTLNRMPSNSSQQQNNNSKGKKQDSPGTTRKASF